MIECKDCLRKVKHDLAPIGAGPKWLRLQCGHEVPMPIRARKVPKKTFCRFCHQACRLKNARQPNLFEK